MILGPINNRWVFTDPYSKNFMYQFKWFQVLQHVFLMIRNDINPDDPEAASYFVDLTNKRQFAKRFSYFDRLHYSLAKRQKNLCPICFESLYNGEDIHVHHIIERSSAKGGTNKQNNLVLLHLSCHYQVHYAEEKNKAQFLSELKVHVQRVTNMVEFS